MSSNYEMYKVLMRKIADVGYSAAVLGWDQEVYMPVKGAAIRARNSRTFLGVVHGMATSDELGQLLLTLYNDESLSEKEKVNVMKSLRDYKLRKKYSTDFVELMNRNGIRNVFRLGKKQKKKIIFLLCLS